MKKKFLLLSIISALAACGGGGDEPRDKNQPPAATLPSAPPAVVIHQPTVTPVQPPAADQPPPVIDKEADAPTVTIPTNPDFEAKLQRAPANGSYICSSVIIHITGKGIKNAELVHGDNYATYARFSTSVEGTFAVLQFNPRQVWANGAIRVRVLAWDQPPGSPQAHEVEVMPERTWIIANDAEPCKSLPGVGSIVR